MPTESGFLTAIIAYPDDDAPRLIYSDWLDEQGRSERAEFIRVQCAVAQHEAAIKADPKRHAGPRGHICACEVCSHLDTLRLRERELLGWGRHYMEWAGLLDLLPRGIDPPKWEYRRGFVSTITCTATDFLRHADAILWHPAQERSCPLTAQPIHRVTLTTWPTPESVHIHGDGYSFKLPGRPVRRIRKSGGWRVDAEGMVEVLNAEWPGVEFELPRLINASWSNPPGNIADDLRAIADSLLAPALDLSPGDAVLSEAARRLEIRDPDTHPWRLVPAPEEPRSFHEVLCDCRPQEVAQSRALSEMSSRVPSFYRVTLRPCRFIDNDRNETAVYVGQCENCNAIIWTALRRSYYGPSPLRDAWPAWRAIARSPASP